MRPTTPLDRTVLPSEGRRTAKGERTLERIFQTALELFRRDGYEATTMRGIAKATDLSVGNAYYYFESKAHIVQAFYERMVLQGAAAGAEVLRTERGFADRLRGVLHRKLDVLEPYHNVAGAIARAALAPGSPISPLSASSSPARRAAIAFFEEVVAGSAERFHVELRAELPEMLWLAGESLALFWVHDDSPDRHRTRAMIDDTSELIGRLVKMAGLPLFGPVRKLVTRLTRTAVAR